MIKEEVSNDNVQLSTSKPKRYNHFSEDVEYDKKKLNIKEKFSTYYRYAIFTNPSVPDDVITSFTAYSRQLEDYGFVLRARLDDRSPLEASVVKAMDDKDLIEVYLPWKNFNNVNHEVTLTKPKDEAYEIANFYSKVFPKLKPAVRAFIARDTHIILGDNLNKPIHFLVTWTEDGVETLQELSGKTGYSYYPIKLTLEAKKPVFNLKRDDALYRLKQYVESLIHPN